MPLGSYSDHNVQGIGARITQVNIHLGLEFSRFYGLEIENHFLGFTRLYNSIIVIVWHYQSYLLLPGEA